MAMDPNRDPAVALQYTCPFCGAGPVSNCWDETRGIILELPHYSRTPETAASCENRQVSDA